MTGPLAVFVLGLLFLGALLWLWLERHERRRAAGGLPRHGRLAIAAAAMLMALFAAMTGLIAYSPAALALGLPLVAVGLVVWWLAMRRGSG